MKSKKEIRFIHVYLKEIVLASALLFFSTTLFSQTKVDVKKETKIISFGETLKLGNVDQNIVASITDLNTNVSTSLRGNEISNFIFEIPGVFEVAFKDEHTHDEDECKHNSYPEVLLVKVSPYKMDFDFSTITFNKMIISGVELENIEMSINVNVKTHDNKQFVFENGQMVTAGIGTTIVGKLINNSYVLFPGSNKLTYKISGSATKDTYIMFDFFDINNQVQSYYYPTKL